MVKILFATVCLLVLACEAIQSTRAAEAEVDVDARSVSSPQGLPAYLRRFDRPKPFVAVVGENRFTELTDYVVPYGVLSESGAAEVFALATRDEPIQMFPALRIQPHASVAQFDVQYPRGADYVVVPAVHYTDDVVLLDWIASQAEKGATIVGVCDGVWVLGKAGLLEGRRAVGHWYSFEKLVRDFPLAEFVPDTRYLADGNIITTTGVTASIPVSLALVEAIAGRDRALATARTLGTDRWDPSHQSSEFQLRARHVFTAAGNWLSFWSHAEIELPIAVGVDEVSLALVADAYSRTYRSKAISVAPTLERVVTLRGLTILPDETRSVEDAGVTIDVTHIDSPIVALNSALENIEQLYGPETAAFVALQLEYPWP